MEVFGGKKDGHMSFSMLAIVIVAEKVKPAERVGK